VQNTDIVDHQTIIVGFRDIFLVNPTNTAASCTKMCWSIELSANRMFTHRAITNACSKHSSSNQIMHKDATHVIKIYVVDHTFCGHGVNLEAAKANHIIG